MEEWKDYKLEEICTKITDGSHFSPQACQTGYPMFSVKDMLEYGFDYSNCKHISAKDFESMKNGDCVPQKGDILVAKDGSFLKQIFECKETKEEAILSSIAIFRPNQNIITPTFLCYLLKSPKVYNYIALNCVSGSALPRIVLKDFKKVTMQVPPLPTQQKIAAILSSLDDKIELNNKINTNLEQQAQALFKNWFVDFEPFGGKMPEGWRMGKAEEYFDITIGKTPPRKEQEWFSEKKNERTVKWVSISDMGNCGIYISDSSEYLTLEACNKFNVTIIPTDTVILSFKLTVGRVAITDDAMCSNEAIAHFKTDRKEINEYLYIYLKNFNYQTMGSTSSIAVAVNSKIIKAMPFVVPDNKTINQFHDLVGSFFYKIRKNQRENRNLASLRDILLPKLMNGEIDVESVTI